MSRPTQQMRDFAERLISYEANGNKAATHSVFHIFEKLRPHLATLMGISGFRALLSRALVLAQEEVPLAACGACESGWRLWKGWKNFTRRLLRTNSWRESTVLLAQLLGLLVAFIGEKLTLQTGARSLARTIALKDLDFNKGQSK